MPSRDPCPPWGGRPSRQEATRIPPAARRRVVQYRDRNGGCPTLDASPSASNQECRRPWIGAMRRPKRRRDNPKARVVRTPPDGVSLEDIAQKVTYVSSPYHSSAARIRRPRPDATKCPPEVSNDLERVKLWLREAIRLGRIGTWDNGFPRYVWHRVGDVIFEARQGSPGSGEYHGYPLYPDQDVRGLA